MATPSDPKTSETTIEPQNEGVSRKTFLTTAAKAVVGAAAATAALDGTGALASETRRHLPEIMRKGNPVTLTYYFGANAAEAKVRQHIFDQFTAANPDIKIVTQLDGTSHLQKLNTELAGGKPPDLMMSWELDYSSYAKRGVYMDLHQFIKHDSEFQHKVMAQEYPSVLNMFSLKNKLYSLPEQVTDTVLFYNKDHVAEAGLKMPTDWHDKSWTWDKFLHYAKKLTQTEGGRVTRYGFTEMWFWPLTASNVIAAANGGNWFKHPVFPKAGSSNLASHRISEAIQWYADLSTVHNVAAPSQALTSQPGFQLFMTGKASMGIVGHWFYSAFSGTKDLHFDIAPVPIGPGGGHHSRTNLGGTGISISAKTKYPEQAWRFAKFWAGLHGQHTIARSGLWVPALKNVGQSTAYTRSNSAMKHATVFTSVLKEGYVHSLPISTAWPEFSIPWGNTLIDIWQGKQTAKDALPNLDGVINADIRKY